VTHDLVRHNPIVPRGGQAKDPVVAPGRVVHGSHRSSIAPARVALEHRNLDRHGDGWEGMREGVRGDQGWSLYLERFAAAAVDGI
jgi:hypothetical protein